MILLSTFDFNDTVLFPVLGGIFAGIVVILIEWSFRSLHDCKQRKKAERSIGKFFGEWNSCINNAVELRDEQGVLNAPKIAVQFAIHKDFLRSFPIVVDRWSRFLTEQQTEEVRQFVRGHEGGIVGIIPSGKAPPEPIYSNFFRDSKEIKWLKF